jgi:hypothetical protein
MDARSLLVQVQSDIGATCDRAVRQASLIAARERQGLSTDRERNVLRGIRVSLGLEYHHEAVLLGRLAGGEAGGDRVDRRAAPARRRCHRGVGGDCPLPIPCCATLAATLTSRSPAGAARR